MDYRTKIIYEGDIRCHNAEKADIRFQDGGLRHVVGASHFQVTRASRNKDLASEGRGWTYNHAPMLVYWNNHFLIEYISGETSEHIPPSAAFLCISADGIHWDKPRCVFPPISVPAGPYKGPKKELLTGDMADCIVHHRMGFYVASNNRLLVLTFYGISPTHNVAPNNGYGVGRVVREIKEDFSFGEIFFIRYNEKGGYNRGNSENFRYYRESDDAEFVKACDELLANRLVTQQWWEEERLDAEFFTRPGAQAFCYYTLPNGDIMSVFKYGYTSVSKDGGETWSELKKSCSIETANGKVWGQKTSDGRYALVYNPSPDGAHRWPLAVVTGDNGIDFDSLLAITPEISPCRFEGMLKNLGAQYVRGVCEANPQIPDDAMWVVYSVNKEDIWVSRVPVPIRGTESSDVDEDFGHLKNGLPENWNLYVPLWGRVEATAGKGLLLSDWDPYNRAFAERMLVPAAVVRLDTAFTIEQLEKPSAFTIELCDRHGVCPVKLIARPNRRLYAHIGGMDHQICDINYGQRTEITITADCVKNHAVIRVTCGLNVTEKEVVFAQPVHQVERIIYRTKETLPFQTLEHNGKNGDIGNLPDADEIHKASCIYIHSLKSKTIYEK